MNHQYYKSWLSGKKKTVGSVKGASGEGRLFGLLLIVIYYAAAIDRAQAAHFPER